MKNLRVIILPLILAFCFSSSGQSSFAGDNFVSVRYISPVPGSKYVLPQNNIAIRHGVPFLPSSLRSGLIQVRGRESGVIPGKITLSDDNKTVLFLPSGPYAAGDTIFVTVDEGLILTNGLRVSPESWWFVVSESAGVLPEAGYDYPDELIMPPVKPLSPAGALSQVNDNDYPDDYGRAIVTVNENPPHGYYFYAPYNGWSLYPETDPYITLVDEYGVPLFYREFETEAFDFKRQPGGWFSCYTYHPVWGDILMDSLMNPVDTFQMGNGYTYTDFHDFQVLENGHVYVMTFDPQIVDMSQIVPGGNPQAVVTGFVFQELDSQHNVVFQWRSWDHFEITETGPEIDLLSDQIDYVHGNTVEPESDSTIIISSRNMHEITRIDRNTGEIIWRFGGSQNQFTFLNDTLGFSRQHDSRRIENGHLTAFDNGSYHPEPQFSSVVEYLLDEENMTAQLIHRYRHTPDYFGWAMGNGFRTAEKNFVVGWGTSEYGITEFDTLNNVVWEASFDGFSYRAYRFDFNPGWFYSETDTLHFGYIWKMDSLLLPVQIKNPLSGEITLTGSHLMTDNFRVQTSFPLTVPGEGSAQIKVWFVPGQSGTFTDRLTLNSDRVIDGLNERKACQIDIIGYATENQSVDDVADEPVQLFPNPAHDYIKIVFPSGNKIDLSAGIYTVEGVLVKKIQLCGGENTLDVSGLPEGLYVLHFHESRLKPVRFIVK